MHKGPIILIDDDSDDNDLTQEALLQTGFSYEVIVYSDGPQAFDGICEIVKKERPFLIICDINLPGMNGIELKQRIDEDKELRSKSIPFVFLSTAGDESLVKEAYDSCIVQGFFTKQTKMSTFVNNLKTILEYWELARTPA